MGFRRIAPLVLLASLAVAGSARAADETGDVKVHEFDANGAVTAQTAPAKTYVTYLLPGPLVSFVAGDAHALGLGFEVSVMHHKSFEWSAPCYGGFFQAQLYDGTHPRFGIGGQGALGPLGMELGIAYRGGDGQRGDTFGLQAAIFLSVGYVNFAVRASPGVFAVGGGPAFGTETAIVLAFKLPIVIGGADPTGMAVGHRE